MSKFLNMVAVFALAFPAILPAQDLQVFASGGIVAISNPAQGGETFVANTLQANPLIIERFMCITHRGACGLRP